MAEMTESVVLEEYGQMVAEGIQRQKTFEMEINNNKRASYMDRLGVNTRGRDEAPDTRNNRISGVSLDTFNFGENCSSNRNTTNLTALVDP